MLLNNIFLKILSVLLAISLWLIVATSDYDQVQFNVPVKLINVPDKKVAVTDESLINVTLNGPRLVLNSLSYNDVSVEVNVRNFSAYQTDYRIKPSDVKVPSSVNVVRIQPAEITVTIDKIVHKNIEVTPAFIGEPAEGFKVGSLQITPSEVEVTGAASTLNDIDYIETLPINLSGKSEKMSYSVGLKKFSGIKSIDPSQVEVTVIFSENMVKRKLSNIAVTVVKKNKDYNYKLLTNEVDAQIDVRSDIADSKDLKKRINIYVDVSQLTPGQYLRNIEYSSGENIKIIEIIPGKARVEVTK
ncbi:CdaR family protein [Flexistipes sp.]|uniref:CdaR family protein n=1 Tax=Flexistipes sp. TaxID=3088135 RepID=UPI002E1F7E05|nr:CdaR family protein [Flexistipes sp.]